MFESMFFIIMHTRRVSQSFGYLWLRALVIIFGNPTDKPLEYSYKNEALLSVFIK
jgi:hypothetical protein